MESDFSFLKFWIQVARMVSGMKNSTSSVGKENIFKVLVMSVMEWPMVNAVTSNNRDFQPDNSKGINSTKRNKMWSYAFKSAMCSTPILSQNKKSFNSFTFVLIYDSRQVYIKNLFNPDFLIIFYHFFFFFACA